MEPLPATVVETESLWQTVVAALAIGVGTVFSFSIGLLGAALYGEASREGRPLLATGFAVLAAAGFAVTLAAVAFGVIVMATK